MKTTEHSNTSSVSNPLPKGDGALHKAAMSAHHVVDKVAGAADEAARKAGPAIDRAAEYAHQSVDKAVHGVTPTAEWLNEQASALNATQQKFIRGTRDYVATNPLKALGIALATGYLISRIFGK